jgi:predicted glycosyltransferase
MKVAITIQHPAHVHFFKNTIRRLRKAGHQTYVFVRRKDIAENLLHIYDINHEVLVNSSSSLAGLARTQFLYETRLWQRVRKINPDVMTAIGGTAVAHLSTITNAKSIIFTDTETAELQNKLTFPFADCICTPECYQDNLGPKHVQYPGYHELAYLHPNHFEPDPTVLDDLGLDAEDQFVILRLVSWDATHDIGDSGFKSIQDVVAALEETGAKVFITTEDTLPDSVEHRQVSIQPHRMHDLMYYSDLFIGESATMASESAVLGTPAVFVSSSRRGYTDELEDRYGLVFNYSGLNRQRNGLDKALSILKSYDKQLWLDRREEMLEDKIDTTEFMLKKINEASENL